MEEASEMFHREETMDYSHPIKDQLVKEPGKKVLSTSGISKQTTLTRTDTPNITITSLVSHGCTVKPINASSVTMMRTPSNLNLNTSNKNNWVEPCSGSSLVINTLLFLTVHLIPLELNNEKH